MARLLDVKTFPQISTRVHGERFVIDTYLRKQDREGKWHLCYFKKSMDADHRFDGPRVSDEYRMLFCEIYRFMLFGIVTIQIKDLNGEQIHILDEDQSSEHGRYYSMDHLMFPKGEPPKKSERFPNEWDDELIQIWEDKFSFLTK